MVSQSLSVDVLVRILTIFPYLSKKISEPLHNLFLSQMADKMFKKNLAIAYAEGYAIFTQAYGRGYGTTECSIFSLSVQFLNRDFLVSEIVDSHDFFPSACASIEHMLESAYGPAQKEDKDWSVAGVKEMTEQLLRHPILTHRRYSPMFSDLKVNNNSYYLPVLPLFHSSSTRLLFFCAYSALLKNPHPCVCVCVCVCVLIV